MVSGGGDFTDEDAERFLNRSRVRDEIMHPSAGGPDTDDLDVIGALKGLHSRIDQGIDSLVKGRAKSVAGFGSARRDRLIILLGKLMKDPKSIYFNWGRIL